MWDTRLQDKLSRDWHRPNYTGTWSVLSCFDSQNKLAKHIHLASHKTTSILIMCSPSSLFLCVSGHHSLHESLIPPRNVFILARSTTLCVHFWAHLIRLMKLSCLLTRSLLETNFMASYQAQLKWLKLNLFSFLHFKFLYVSLGFILQNHSAFSEQKALVWINFMFALDRKFSENIRKKAKNWYCKNEVCACSGEQKH